MNKSELTEILDKLSDEKLDLFISFLRELSKTESPELPCYSSNAVK